MKRKLSTVEFNQIITAELMGAVAGHALKSSPNLFIDLVATAVRLAGEIDAHAHHLVRTTEFQHFVALLSKILKCKNGYKPGSAPPAPQVPASLTPAGKKS